MERKDLKRLAAAVILLGLLVSMAAGYLLLRRPRGRPSPAADERLTVVATLPLFAGLVERIGGREVRVVSIVRGGICAHEYEPTPRDMERLAGAALFVKAGAGLDPWADGLLAGLGGRKPFPLDASAGVLPAEERGAGSHYWGDPEKAARAAENILKGLCAVRPRSKDLFRRNYEAFRAELIRTATTLRAEAARLGKKELVSYSAAFSPFFAYFGFANLATVEEAHEEEVSARRLMEVARLVRERGIRVVVGEASDPRPAKALAEETGARLVILWPATDPTGDYLHTLRRNVALLCEGFR